MWTKVPWVENAHVAAGSKWIWMGRFRPVGAWARHLSLKAADGAKTLKRSGGLTVCLRLGFPEANPATKTWMKVVHLGCGINTSRAWGSEPGKKRKPIKGASWSQLQLWASRAQALWETLGAIVEPMPQGYSTWGLRDLGYLLSQWLESCQAKEHRSWQKSRSQKRYFGG